MLSLSKTGIEASVVAVAGEIGYRKGNQSLNATLRGGGSMLDTGFSAGIQGGKFTAKAEFCAVKLGASLAGTYGRVSCSIQGEACAGLMAGGTVGPGEVGVKGAFFGGKVSCSADLDPTSKASFSEANSSIASKWNSFVNWGAEQYGKLDRAFTDWATTSSNPMGMP